MTRLARMEWQRVGRVPRPRGDDPVNMHPTNGHNLCSPPHAGMTRASKPMSLRRYSVPRPRGDDPDLKQAVSNARMCSPPTRGLPSPAMLTASSWYVFPAYAGVTYSSAASNARRSCVLDYAGKIGCNAINLATYIFLVMYKKMKSPISKKATITIISRAWLNLLEQYAIALALAFLLFVLFLNALNMACEWLRNSLELSFTMHLSFQSGHRSLRAHADSPFPVIRSFIVH